MPQTKSSARRLQRWKKPYLNRNNGNLKITLAKLKKSLNPTPIRSNANSSDAPPDEDSKTIIGFKTIRFFQNGGKTADDESMVQFVKDRFPCSRIPVNIRSDSESQAKSQKSMGFRGSQKTVSIVKELESLNQRLVNVQLFWGEQAYLLDSSLWTKSVSALNCAVKWLGFNPHCQFQELLEMNV